MSLFVPSAAPRATNGYKSDWRSTPVRIVEGYDFGGMSGLLIPRNRDDVVPTWLGQLIADARSCRGKSIPTDDR